MPTVMTVNSVLPPFGPLAITTSQSLPNAIVGMVYAIQFTAVGGVLPYRWTLAAANGPGAAGIPAGAMNTTTGLFSWTPVATGAAVLTIQVRDARNNFVQELFSFSTVSSSTDTIAPTIPTGFALTSGSSNQLVWDTSSDPFFPGQLPAGLANYVVTRDGNTSFATVSSSAGISPQYTYNDIGTITVPGSATQAANGVDWSITAEGTDIFNSPDAFGYLSAPVNASATGIVTETVRLNSLSSVVAFAKMGLMFRSLLTPDSPYVLLTFQNTGNGINLIYRTTQGGNATQAGIAAPAFPLWLQLVWNFTAGTFTPRYSVDGNNWQVPTAPISVSLPANSFAGLAVCSHSAGNLATAGFAQLGMQNLPQITYSDAAGGAHTYSVRAVDGATNASANTTTLSSAAGNFIAIAAGANKGKFVNQAGALVGGSFNAEIGGEEPWGYKDGTGRSMAGWGKVTTAQYLAADATNIATVAAAARPALTTKGIRLLFNSGLWMAATGRDPQMPSSPGSMTNNYYPAGTDSAGHALYCGGPGGGPGTGIGHELFGDPTLYRNYVMSVITQATGAGYFVLLDMHFATPVLSNGQCVLPVGQTAFPSTLDQTCWVSVAQAVLTLPNPNMVICGLFNEIYGTNSGATGIERAYMGSQSLTPFPFPTATTGNASSSLSNGRGTAVGYTMFDNAGDNNNYVICGGNQTSQSVGFQSLVNAIRGTGFTGIICVGNQSYNTQISSYSAIGGNMVVNDTLNPSQLCIDQHYDTGATWAQFQSLQAAGWGVMSTEMNSISATNGGYQTWLANGCLYSFWGGWTNFATGIANWPPSTDCYLSGIMTGKDQNNAAQAEGGTPWRTASIVPNGSN